MRKTAEGVPTVIKIISVFYYIEFVLHAITVIALLYLGSLARSMLLGTKSIHIGRTEVPLRLLI